MHKKSTVIIFYLTTVTVCASEGGDHIELY